MDITLETVYLFLFFVGLFFAVLSLIFQAVGGGFDGGGADVHPGGDLLHQGDIVGGEQTAGHEIHFSPFSLPVIATFATAFGGAGYLSHKLFEQSAGVSIVVAVLSGLVIALLLFTLISKLLIKSQASSEPRTSEMIGTTAEVTISIPKGGTGEIGYTTMGTRYTAPAVSVTGEEIPSRTIVLIQRITSGLFHVEPLRTGAKK